MAKVNYSIYKYRLKELIGTTPSDEAKALKKKLIKAIGGDFDRFQCDWKILITQKRKQIPIERLVIYAQELECSIEDLLNKDLLKN